MEQYIPKSAVVAQANIEITGCRLAAQQGILTEFGKGKLEALEGIVDFLNTLEVKEVDLEKEIKEEYLKRRCYGGRDNMFVVLNEPQFNNIAVHFFELGLKAKDK